VQDLGARRSSSQLPYDAAQAAVARNVARAATASGYAVTIVVPAYNEARRLTQPLYELGGVLEQHNAELIVVDDGSTDGTSVLARRCLAGNARARVIRQAQNRGKGAAVRTGFSAARGRSIVFMDADLATDLGDLDALLLALEDSDIALGSRADPATVIETSTARRSLMGVQFNRLVRQVTKLPLHDTQCGFKGFRASTGKLLMHLSAIDGFAFDVEVLALADRLGFRSSEVPVHWREVAGTHVRPFRDPARMAVDVISTRFRQRNLHQLLPVLTVPCPTEETGDIAHVLRTTLRHADTVAELDESVKVLLPSTHFRQAIGVSSRVQRALPDHAVRLDGVSPTMMLHPTMHELFVRASRPEVDEPQVPMVANG
jgi:hypothetical protein